MARPRACIADGGGGATRRDHRPVGGRAARGGALSDSVLARRLWNGGTAASDVPHMRFHPLPPQQANMRELWRQRCILAGWAGCLAASTLAGCRDTNDMTGIGARPRDGARKDYYDSYDCNLDSATCASIQRGIDELTNHWSQTCRDRGYLAQSLMNAPAGQGGFTTLPVADTPWDGTWEMAVPMERSSGTASGWASTSTYVTVSPAYGTGAAYSDANAAAGLISHEMEHMINNDGPRHNTGISYMTQDLCRSKNNS